MKKIDFRLDNLRVLSMFLVIVIHLANYYCRAYSDISTFSYVGALSFNALARISVPIFFMISGALLLSKEYDEHKNKERIKRIIITLTIFTIFYLLWDKFYMHKDFGNLISLLTSPKRSMLWFLYAIIALYIALPYTKILVDGMSETLEKRFVVLWIILNGGFYLLDICINIDLKYLVPFISGTYYLGYFVVGYLIYKYKDKIDYKKYNYLWISIFTIASLITIILSFYASVNKNRYIDSFLAYRSLLIILSSLSAFIFIYFNTSEKECKFISKISPYSFGVYLVHGFLLNLLMEYFPYQRINSFIGVPIGLIILGITSLFLVFILKKIPALKKYI
ncbi:MAG: hypothetical protein E7164_00515 [Firmicutes bacterium]|nr:hypothetical protein [Bacillota bacterium]